MNQEIVDYIKQQIKFGVPKDKIAGTLLGQGWHKEEVDEAFGVINGQPDEKNEPAVSFDDVDGNGDGGLNRKPVVIIAAVLLLAAVAGLIYFVSMKKEDAKTGDQPINQPAETKKAENSEAGNNTETKAATDAAQKAKEEELAKVMAQAKVLQGTITGPKDWLLKMGSTHSRAVVAYFKQIEGAREDGVSDEYVSVSSQEISAAGAADMADYIAKTKKAFLGQNPDYKPVADRKVNIDGIAVTIIGGTFTLDKVLMTNIQLLAAKDGVAYVVTGAAPTKIWEKEKSAINTAVMSFKFPKQ